jgi:hypothetical protein
MKSDLYRLNQKYRGAPTKKSAYAKGGSVRRHFDGGGLNDMTGDGGDGSGQADTTGGAGQGAATTATPVVVAQPAAPQAAGPVVVAPAAAAAVTPPANAAATVTPPASAPPDRAAELEAMLNRYAPPSNQYTRELAESRRRAQTETEAFTNMIQQMSQRGESPTSRAEMYFRLAAAFGSPTKTGKFAENLSLVGKEMSEYAKGRRTEENDMRNLALKAQETRMTGARQDLTTAQALASQELSERRGLAREVIKEYLASGRPQSEAGKLAEDAGLRPGTPEHSEFVRRYVASKIESGEAFRQVQIEIQQGNLLIRREAEARAAERARELTPAEQRMRLDAENNLSAAEKAIRTVSQALEINDNTFGTSTLDAAQYAARSALGANDPRTANTSRLRVLLGEAAIAQLKESFGGQGITDSERAALDRLQGILSTTPEQRRPILERTLDELRRAAARQRALAQDLTSGRYRQQQPAQAAEPAQPAQGGTQ